jgi:hypothetical protein
MGRDARAPRRFVIGPEGDILRIGDLRSLDIARSVLRTDPKIVAAISGGLLALCDASEHYGLTPQEFLTWQDALDNFNVSGLLATSPWDYRH